MGNPKRSKEQIELDIENQEKTCCVCNIRKSFGDFYNFKNKSDGKSYRCKVCDYESRKEYSKRNPVRFNRLKRDQDLKIRYGISLEDYERIFLEQGMSCAICKSKETRAMSNEPTSFSVDHCHLTGTIRGILCNQCNRGLGMLGDTAEALSKALDYLNKERN